MLFRQISLWAAVLYLLLPVPCRAEGGAAFLLQSLSVITHENDAHLDVSASVSHLAAIQAALREGASFNLDTELLLELLRTLFPNKVIKNSQFRCQLRFDPLTREYLLLRQDAPPMRQKKLDLLFDAALGDVVYPLALPADLASGDRFRASLTLSLRYADVPPWLRKTLFFWSWDVIAPTTFTLEFSPDVPVGEPDGAALLLKPAQTAEPVHD